MNRCGRLKILVIDRDTDLVHSLARILRLEGYAVDEAAHAPVAITLAAANEPDIVILDALRPDRVGIHRRLRQICHQAAFLMTVGTEPDLQNLRSRGLTVIRKPFEIDQLLTTLETLGRRPSDVCLAS